MPRQIEHDARQRNRRAIMRCKEHIQQLPPHRVAAPVLLLCASRLGAALLLLLLLLGGLLPLRLLEGLVDAPLRLIERG